MEVQAAAFGHRPSVDPIRIETTVAALDDPHGEDSDQHHREEETPVFKEPNWSAMGPTPTDDNGRPLALQPPTREDRMKQHDKALVARLDRGSSSSESGSPSSPDRKTRVMSVQREHNRQMKPDGNQDEHEYQSGVSQTLPAPSKLQEHRPHHQQKRPAPLTLNPTRPTSSHQHPRLPSLSRLVSSNDPQVQQQQHHVRTQDRHQQDRRRFSRVTKPSAINSPTAYRGFTPIQVMAPWQGIHYGWTPMSVPFQMPMQPAPVTSSHQMYGPQSQQRPQVSHPSSTSTATPPSKSFPAPQLREDLWKVGTQYLSNPATSDAFVRAVEIRHGSLANASVGVASREDHMDVDDDSPSSLPDLSANPFGRTLLLRIVIHSPGRASVAMTREFDRGKLRDTIPDFARSPRSPKSGNSAGSDGTTGGPVATPVSAVSTLSLARRRKSLIRAQHQAAASPTTPVSAGPNRRLAMPPVPIHLPYARAHAPALAAVLLLRESHKGDCIDLPMPFPGSWLETSAYMYTGQEELLSERVKQNIWYLGGVPN